MIENIHPHARQQLAHGLAQMAAQQHVIEDTHGNLSCRRDGFICIKPSGVEYIHIVPGDVCTLRLDDLSPIFSGHLKPSVDTAQHAQIYRENPWVNSICHTHSPYATAFAIARRSIRVMCTEHADYFGHEIRCCDYAGLDDWGAFVFPEPHERAVLLGGHGVLTFSDDPDPFAAVKLAVAVEAIAKKYVIASGISGVLQSLEQSEVRRWHDRYTKGGYGQ